MEKNPSGPKSLHDLIFVTDIIALEYLFLFVNDVPRQRPKFLHIERVEQVVKPWTARPTGEVCRYSTLPNRGQIRILSGRSERVVPRRRGWITVRDRCRNLARSAGGAHRERAGA